MSVDVIPPVSVQTSGSRPPCAFVVCERVWSCRMRGSVGRVERGVDCAQEACANRGGGCGVVCDGGLTPIEIIVGVVLLAVLSGVVVFQAFRFIAKADDSAATRSLEAAVTVVEVMGQLGSSGGGNLVGDPNPSTEIAITKLNEQLSGAELTTLEGLDIKLQDDRSGRKASFAHVVGDAQRIWVNVPENSTIHKDLMDDYNGLALKRVRNPNLGKPKGTEGLGHYYLVREYSGIYFLTKEYIDTEYPEFPDGNVYGFRVWSGNLVRVGLKSVSGATFCAILVRDGAVVAANSTNDVIGTGYVTTDKSQLISIDGVGYQSVNAEATAVPPVNLLRSGADCGVFHFAAGGANAMIGNDHWDRLFVAELPGLPGTDTRLMPPAPDSYYYDNRKLS